ncbi:MAG: YdeI/OmpD-associated family protein [Chloroflexota bacterium]
MDKNANWVSFDTTLSAFGNNTGIEVPDEIMAELNAGKRPALLVKINGYDYQNTPGIMNGKTMLSFSSEHRQNTGLAGGDKIHVELAVATTPREVAMSDDFREALQASNTEQFFNTLSNSLQRYHCDLINGAKTAETRQKRIEKAIDLFQAGKKR